MSDFEVYYLTGERVLSGENVYNLDDSLEFKYLPVTALVFSIFSIFTTVEVAKVLWYIICILLIFSIIFKSIKLINGSYDYKLFYLSFLLFIFYFGRELLLGQINVLLIWLAILSIEQLIKGNEIKSGVFLGLSILIKPYTLIFLPYFLINKNYTAFTYSVIIFTLGLLAPFAIYGIAGGIELYRSCFHLLNTTSNECFSNTDNVSIWAFYYKYTENLILSKLLSVVTISLFYIALLFQVYKRNALLSRDYSIDGAALLGLIPLFSPQGWFYQFIMALLCVLLLIVHFKKFSLFTKIIFISMLLFIPLSLSDVSGKAFARLLADYSILTISFSVIILLSCAVRERVKKNILFKS